MSDASRQVAGEWDLEKALAALEVQTVVSGSDNPIKMAQDIFRDNAPLAAMAIVNIATSSPHEATRLKAATYIVERNLGSVAHVNPDAEDDPLTMFVNSIVTEAEDAAIQAAHQALDGSTEDAS
jgi:hypothetical protein